MGSYGGDLIREARRRANLTQRQLAERADTAQPAIARWESGRTAVSLEDVIRLIRLCGLDLELSIVERDDSDMAQAARLAGLTGQQRLDRHARLARQLHHLRQTGTK
ncbi:helix-turn-helix transcriptional regulator [Mycolicibacter sp. MYC123]|uniref:Helix-turn-helix transcriptional regulator n=1 Tax=[Mycobacterium] zoologicum TaxID=2872311 RepID=A0ABU5YK05_9MYCO|nr:helix-turn-helix transcriptional regulator [Mycolicibacter sp. MYC123]MEB3050373.1 helix-turn-helix transcriptional regulator [Mycolicibacter sp. MYC123]